MGGPSGHTSVNAGDFPTSSLRVGVHVMVQWHAHGVGVMVGKGVDKVRGMVRVRVPWVR